MPCACRPAGKRQRGSCQSPPRRSTAYGAGAAKTRPSGNAQMVSSRRWHAGHLARRRRPERQHVAWLLGLISWCRGVGAGPSCKEDRRTTRQRLSKRYRGQANAAAAIAFCGCGGTRGACVSIGVGEEAEAESTGGGKEDCDLA